MKKSLLLLLFLFSAFFITKDALASCTPPTTQCSAIDRYAIDSWYSSQKKDLRTRGLTFSGAMIKLDNDYQRKVALCEEANNSYLEALNAYNTCLQQTEMLRKEELKLKEDADKRAAENNARLLDELVRQEGLRLKQIADNKAKEAEILRLEKIIAEQAEEQRRAEELKLKTENERKATEAAENARLEKLKIEQEIQDKENLKKIQEEATRLKANTNIYIPVTEIINTPQKTLDINTAIKPTSTMESAEPPISGQQINTKPVKEPQKINFFKNISNSFLGFFSRLKFW